MAIDCGPTFNIGKIELRRKEIGESLLNLDTNDLRDVAETVFPMIGYLDLIINEVNGRLELYPDDTDLFILANYLTELRKESPSTPMPDYDPHEIGITVARQRGRAALLGTTRTTDTNPYPGSNLPYPPWDQPSHCDRI